MLHIFDIDKTIIDTSTVKDLMFMCIKSGLIPAAVLLYAPYYFILFTLYGVNEKHFRKPRRFLRGMSEKDLKSAASQMFEERFRKMLFPEILELIKSIQLKGEEVLIASASFKFIIKPIAEHLGIEEIICSELEFNNGLSTGRMKGLPAFHQAKQMRVKSYLEHRGVNPSNCSFYTDSHRDLSLLQNIGKPVAVNPDSPLRRAAEKYGWEIIDLKKTGRSKIWQIS